MRLKKKVIHRFKKKNLNLECASSAYLVKFSPLSAARYKRLERYNKTVEAVIEDRSAGLVSNIETGRV